MYESGFKLNPLSVLKRIKMEFLGYNESFEMSKTILLLKNKGLISDNMLDNFSKTLPALAAHTRERKKENLIEDCEGIIIKKINILKNDFVVFFSTNKLSPQDKIDFAAFTMVEIGLNKELNEMGLLKISKSNAGDESIFFIEFSPDSKVSQTDVKNIFLSTMEDFLSENNNTSLKDILDIQIKQYCLDKKMTNKSEIVNNRKLKKV